VQENAAMPADDKIRVESVPSPVQSPDLLADKGRGDMVSENLAANDRFERNSTALQEQQQAQEQAQQQTAQQALTFGPDRQHGPNLAQLKIEQAKINTPERAQDPSAKDQSAQEQTGKKTLSFGADRQRNRDYSGLKAEQAKTSGKGRDQQQGEKKELSFGPDRGQGKGQGRAPSPDHGR
jgi:hypothetical protein